MSEWIDALNGQRMASEALNQPQPSFEQVIGMTAFAIFAALAILRVSFALAGQVVDPLKARFHEWGAFGGAVAVIVVMRVLRSAVARVGKG